MTKKVYPLLAVAITAMFLMSSAAFLTIDTSADISDVNASVGDDTETLVNLNDPLKFNTTDGPASVNTINNTAGKKVCEYGNGILTFTDSVHIKLSKTLTNNSFFTFNADSDQGITTNEGCIVNIECPVSLVNMTGSGNYAVINCDNWHGFTFRGQGQLNIDTTGSTMAGSYPFHIMYAKGNLYFDDCKVTADNMNAGSYGYGFVYEGNDIKFTKGNIKCFSFGYAFYCKSTSANTDFNQCNILAEGTSKAFKFTNGASKSVSFCNIYGAPLYDEYKKTIEISDIDDYQYVEFEANDTFGLDGGTILIIIGVIIGVIIGLIILVFVFVKISRHRRNKSFTSSNAGSNATPINYEPILPDDGKGRGGSTDTNNGFGFGDQTPSYAPSPVDEPRMSASGDSVEIAVSSKVDAASFAISVDGRVVGYIGTNRSIINVPTGMHDVRIVVNDMGRKEIYKENILFNRPMEFTVVKKFGGYSVQKR